MVGKVDEAPFKGRFFLCMVDKFLKVLDLENFALFDILGEPSYSMYALGSTAINRNLKDLRTTYMLVCKDDVEGNPEMQDVQNGGRPYI